MDDEEKLSTLFSRAVDIHVHVGDHNHRDGGLQRNGQRRATAWATGSWERHFLSFVPNLYMFSSVTLNRGLNPKLIELQRK